MSVRVQTQDFDLSREVKQLTGGRTDVGAIVTFTGTVRAESEGRGVVALEYESFAERAEAQLAALAQEVAGRWPALAVWMEHRTDTLALGEPSVVVAVSTPHRAEAFEAARHGIDTLKATVAIWKRERWADGEAHWPGVPAPVEPGTPT